MKIVFIAKGNSRKRKLLERAVAQVRDSSVFDEVEVLTSAYPGHAIELARQQCGNTDYLVAAGGDGTLNEVVNGCRQAAMDMVVDTPPIGVLALGTANDFLKSTPIAGTAAELLECVRKGASRVIDLGLVSYTAVDGRHLQRYFINVADVGVGAAVVQAVNRAPGYFGPNLRYLQAILGGLLGFSKPWLNIEFARGLEWRGKAIAVIAGNGASFGSGLYAVPQARIDDGLLHVAVIGDVGIIDFIGKIACLKRGRPIDHPEVAYYAVSRLDIASPGTRCAIEADGEYLGLTPVRIEIVPAAVRMLIPPGPDTDQATLPPG